MITFYTVEEPGTFGRDRLIVGVTYDGVTEVGLSFRIRGKYVARMTPEKLVMWCDKLASYINYRLERRHRARFNDVFPPAFAEDDDAAM